MKITNMKDQIENPSGLFTAAVAVSWIIVTTVFGDYVVSQPTHPLIVWSSAIAWFGVTFFTSQIVSKYIQSKLNK